MSSVGYGGGVAARGQQEHREIAKTKTKWDEMRSRGYPRNFSHQPGTGLQASAQALARRTKPRSSKLTNRLHAALQTKCSASAKIEILCDKVDGVLYRLPALRSMRHAKKVFDGFTECFGSAS